MPNPPAGSPDYWHLLAFLTGMWAAACRRGDHADTADIAGGLHRAYGPEALLDLCVLAVIDADQRVPADGTRTARGGVDLDQVLPDTAEASTPLAAATALAGGQPSRGQLTIATTVVDGVTRARPTVQRALDAAPGDPPGTRDRVRTVLHEVAEDLLAVSSVFALCGGLLTGAHPPRR